MAKLVRVPIHRTSPTQTVQVEVGATVGARIGTNLLMPDGTVGTLAQLQKLFGAGTPGDSNSINTTDDIEEGAWNLWFTDRRAQDAVGEILVDSANVTLRYVAGTSITADLADVTLITGGTLKLRTFDAKGRLSQESDATTTDLTEGSNLYFTDARADARIPPGYIDGLQMQWIGGTALTVSSGAAYIQGAGSVLRAPTAIAKSGLSFAASTWYHVYLYDNAGTPDVEISTTAPTTAYNGTARSKTGDTSRRYIGSLVTDASSQMRNFSQAGNRVLYKQVGITGRIVANASNTSALLASAASAVPVTAVSVLLKLQNNGPTNTSGYVTPGDITASPSAAVVTVGGVTGGALISFGECPLDSSQQISYVTDATGGTPALYITIINYTFGR